MNERSSGYYPPRAGWNRHLFSFAYALRRRLHLESLILSKLAIETTLGRMLFCLLVPGFSFCDAGWKWLGRTVAISWGIAACIFFIWLGYLTANFAFGLMMSLHVSSIIHFLNRAAPGISVWRRVGLSLAVLFVVGTLVYRTGLNWLQDHLFVPLEVGDKVYVVNRLAPLDTLHRGDWIAFHSQHVGGDGIYIQEGYVLDRILAGPGDEIEFTVSDYRVNGAVQQKLRLMPANGQLFLSKETWLIWPSLKTVTRNNVTEESMAKTVLQIATVKREQIIGKPFNRWFWREQTL